MPEVINLISSTPPRRPEPRELSSIRRFHSSPPATSESTAIQNLSSEIDIQLFTYDDDGIDKDIDKPPKRRRLSHEPESPTNNLTLSTRNSLFLFSDDIDIDIVSSVGQTAKPKAPAWELESDPIVFTSSAPQPKLSPLKDSQAHQLANAIAIEDNEEDGDLSGTARGGRNKERTHSWRDEIEEFSDPLNVPDPSELFNFQHDRGLTENGLSSRTANLLASLGDRSKDRSGGVRTKSKSKQHQGYDDNEEIDEVPEPRKGPGRKKTTTTTIATTATKRSSSEKEAKAREREVAKAQRELARQLEKERKQKLKEEKAKEKQLAADIAEVNKLKVDKKNSTPEMIIDISSTLEGTSVGNQTTEYMRRLGVVHSFFTSPIPNIVKWRRKITAKFNDILGYWEPCPLRIHEEEHVLCLLPAQEFVDMVIDTAADGPSALEAHVLRVKQAYPGCTVIYLIEGLTAWMRKNTNSRNRAYQAEFRRQLDEVQGTQSISTPTSTSTATTTTTTTRKKKVTNKPETTPPVDDDTIEDALLQLQVTHLCLIHHTAAAPDSAEWIKNFTEHISTVPYRRERMEGNDSAFCMDGGQVKPGENKSDTFVKMLQEVNRVTASMAYGTITQYPSVIELVQAMRRHGPGLLEDVKKSANKNGALTDSRIGPAASKRLYKVFMGLDPASTDV